MILDPPINKYIHFGQMGYDDYTKHHDDSINDLRRNRETDILNGETNIKGRWR
jgi:hypothetical protein